MDAASHLVRRSRLRSFAAGAGHFLNLASSEVNLNSSGNEHDIEKRYNPDLTYDTFITNEGVTTTAKTISTAKTTATVKTSTSTSKAATSTVKAATTAASTTKVAAQAATIGTTRTSVTTAVTTSKAAAYVTTSTTSKVSTTSITSSSAVTSSKIATTSSTSSTSTSKSTSSTPTSTSRSTSVAPSTTSSKSATVITITSNNAVATSSSSSAKTSATAAASNSSSTKGMSTTSVVGVVVGVVVGIIALGALVAWLYRKYSARSYSTKSPWSKIDDDITPFPSSFEKDGNGGGDIYGSTNTAPVIGSRRALALARSNAFNPDGSIRPDSEIYERDNRAGLGAGGMSFGPYPTLQQPAAAGMYGLDPHGRPYNPHAGRTPMDHTIDAQYIYDDDPYQYPMPSSRQLVGPPNPMPVAMPMGRPTAPSTDAEFAQAEDFADIPEPYTPGLAYADGAPITPMHENANHTWPNEKEQRGMNTPQPNTSPLINIEPVVTPPTAPVMRMPLPTFAPLSPLSSSFNLNRQSQPLAMYEDEQSQQKRMYGEVAQSAGIDEPTTPYTASNVNGLNDSTTSTTSSFSATAHQPIHNSLPSLISMPRLPELSLAPPPMTQPYQHGQPLSPLNEVPTPLSTMSTPSNPFDSVAAPAYQQPQPHPLAPPYSVSSTTSSFPSPLYPPPSPGGMSVPGSVTDSPRRWSGGNNAVRGGQSTRVISTYEDEDAYGGI